MSRPWFIFVTALLCACGPRAKPAAAPAPVPAPAPAPAKSGAQVMILGVYHFDNPGLDLAKSHLDDHLSAGRQAEIEAVAAALAAFRPTTIMVEAVDQAKLDATFAANQPLTASETQQLGFRLARQLGLAGLVAIDHPGDMDFDRLLAAATASQDQVFLATFEATMKEVEADLARQRERTVTENLLVMNDPANIARMRDIYLMIARVKHGDDFAGPDVLAGWYQRNFRIFANLAAHVTSPDDRVLVIYGGGHAAILRELVAASPNLVLVEPNDFLGR
jgi:hypothetical protein